MVLWPLLPSTLQLGLEHFNLITTVTNPDNQPLSAVTTSCNSTNQQLRPLPLSNIQIVLYNRLPLSLLQPFNNHLQLPPPVVLTSSYLQVLLPLLLSYCSLWMLLQLPAILFKQLLVTLRIHILLTALLMVIWSFCCKNNRSGSTQPLIPQFYVSPPSQNITLVHHHQS